MCMLYTLILYALPHYHGITVHLCGYYTFVLNHNQRIWSRHLQPCSSSPHTPLTDCNCSYIGWWTMWIMRYQFVVHTSKLITILSQVKGCLFCTIACFISCMGQLYFPCTRNKKKKTDYNNGCMTAEELGSKLVLFSQLSPLKQAFTARSQSHWPLL